MHTIHVIHRLHTIHTIITLHALHTFIHCFVYAHVRGHVHIHVHIHKLVHFSIYIYNLYIYIYIDLHVCNVLPGFATKSGMFGTNPIHYQVVTVWKEPILINVIIPDSFYFESYAVGAGVWLAMYLYPQGLTTHRLLPFFRETLIWVAGKIPIYW